MSFFFTKKNKGFTLVESLVAISILSISILGAFTAVQGSLQYSINVKDQITAFYLIQEAMELIKNVRDENALTAINGGGGTWLTGLSAVNTDKCWFGKTCTIDTADKSVFQCGGGFDTCPYLKQDPSSKLFQYSTGSDTIFRREIQFSNISSPADREVLVTIRVSWTSRGVGKNVQVSETLFNR